MAPLTNSSLRRRIFSNKLVPNRSGTLDPRLRLLPTASSKPLVIKGVYIQPCVSLSQQHRGGQIKYYIIAKQMRDVR